MLKVPTQAARPPVEAKTPPPPQKLLRRRIFEPFGLLAWLVSLGLIAATWKSFPSPDVPMNLATISTGLFFGWRASLVGPVWEILYLFQIFGSIGVGFLGREFFAGLAGFTGLAGLIFGFYTGFFLTYLGTAVLFFYISDPTQIPGHFSRCTGFILGAAEGILLTGILAFTLALFPQAGFSPEGRQPLASALAQKVFQPLIPDSASGTIELVQVAGQMKSGFDPARVDQEELKRQFAPVLQNPKLLEIADDPELRDLAQKGNIAACLQHPKIRALITDPEMIKIADRIDLHKIAETLRPGLLQPNK